MLFPADVHVDVDSEQQWDVRLNGSAHAALCVFVAVEHFAG